MPHLPSISVESALRFLVDAPTVFKALAPVSWAYVQPPPDGTVWLEWIPQHHGEYRFASDGYVWGDPEQTYRQEYGGYVMELMVHTVGFRLQSEAMAGHARTRYHLIAKNSGVNAPAPDPNLWLVHYHQSDTSRMLPSQSVPVTVQMGQMIRERAWLEAQGALQRKEFMLHDREHWPQLQLPGHAHMPHASGVHGGNATGALPRYPQYAYPPMATQGPPSKRARHSGPTVGVAAAATTAAPVAVDTSVEDEEETSLGDYFDHLTPREISKTRYTQHHQWMEEVFSSPYASHQIVPADLGLGLMGELKGLTDGIMPAPRLDDVVGSATKPADAATKPADPAPAPLQPAQLAAFTARVADHMRATHADMARMARAHAATLAACSASSALLRAETRLRAAAWDTDGADGADGAADAADAPDAPELVAHVLADAQRSLHRAVRAHPAATMVARGGLEMLDAREMSPAQPAQPQLTGTGIGTGTGTGKATATATGIAPSPPPPVARERRAASDTAAFPVGDGGGGGEAMQGVERGGGV